MIWAALVIVCILMLIVFFGVTIAGGRAHDRQNMENARKKERTDVQVWDEATNDPERRTRTPLVQRNVSPSVTAATVHENVPGAADTGLLLAGASRPVKPVCHAMASAKTVAGRTGRSDNSR